MGIDEEPATLVELGEVEKPKICSSAGALLADDAQAPEAEETDVPAPSGPMF